MSFSLFLMKPFISMKLFLFLLLLISMLLLERPRKHQLYPMLKAFLIQRIFSIPTDSLLIVFLKYSQELRDFCGFDVVPGASKFTRFKQDFLLDLQSMFDHMVDLTEPICQKIDPKLASMLPTRSVSSNETGRK
jgi:hypothetical protein